MPQRRKEYRWRRLNKSEYIQLRDLLIKYLKEKKAKYDWFSSDEIDWLVEEIERDDLEIPDKERTCWKDMYE